MKAGSRADRQAAEQPEQLSNRAAGAAEAAVQPSRNNLWPAAATKDCGERAQTAQLGEKTLGEINTW